MLQGFVILLQATIGKGNAVVTKRGKDVILSKSSHMYRQRFEGKINGMFIITKTTKDISDFVVGIGGVWVLIAEDSPAYLKRLLIVF